MQSSWQMDWRLAVYCVSTPIKLSKVILKVYHRYNPPSLVTTKRYQWLQKFCQITIFQNWQGEAYILSSWYRWKGSWTQYMGNRCGEYWETFSRIVELSDSQQWRRQEASSIFRTRGLQTSFNSFTHMLYARFWRQVKRKVLPAEVF